MYKQEQIKPYEGTGDKGKLVEEMFDNIAPTYDTLNHRLSWDIDKGMAQEGNQASCALLLLNRCSHRYRYRRFRHPSRTDATSRPANPEQTSRKASDGGIGRQKVKQLGLENTISFAKEDCLNLSFQDRASTQ